MTAEGLSESGWEILKDKRIKKRMGENMTIASPVENSPVGLEG